MSVDSPKSSTEAKLGANYWRLWVGNVVSNFGDGVAGVAYPWLASAVTRDPVAIALVALATRLPWLVFTLPAGVITDRVDRRRLVMSMDVARTALTLAVAFIVLSNQASLSSPEVIAAGTAGVPSNSGFLLAILYITGLMLGTAEVLRDNAAQTLLPSIVDKSLLQRANGRMWGAESVMNSFAGPVVGGLLLATAFSLPFFVDSATFAVAALMTLFIAGDFKPKGGVAATERPSWVTDVKEGFMWLWTRPFLRALAISLGVLNGLGMATMATYVLFVQEILELGATGFAVMMWAGAVGGIVGSFLAERIAKRLGNGPSLFLTIIVGGLTALVIGLTSVAAVVWVMFLFGAFSAVLWNVITVSLRQTIIPDQLLGRVNSVYRMFGWGMMPIGSLAGGLLVKLGESMVGRDFGLRLPFLVAAGAHVLLFAYALPRLNSARIAAALEDAESSA
ncbi:MAG: MFS transporter [Acidimicrobiia bacterium]|nr:MFS transporter [Acidimicrobiia bacterium]